MICQLNCTGFQFNGNSDENQSRIAVVNFRSAMIRRNGRLARRGKEKESVYDRLKLISSNPLSYKKIENDTFGFAGAGPISITK